MKHLFLGTFATCLFLLGDAQIKVSDKAVISTPSVQCDKCKEKIEFFIGKSEGVTSVKVDIKRKTTTVTWLTDRTNKESIKTGIANLGYDADDIEAEEYAYKRLPKCCKKPVKVPESPAPKG